MAFPGTPLQRSLHVTAKRIRDELGKGQEVLRQRSFQLVGVSNSEVRGIVLIPDVAIKLVSVKLVSMGANIGAEATGSFDLLAPAVYDEAAAAGNRLVNQLLGYDVDQYVVSTNMKVGAYTLAATSAGDGYAHGLTVTHSQVGGVTDTLGTIDIVGTDRNGQPQTETITPSDGAAVLGVKSFLTVTSVTGVGWVINVGNDTITVGYSDLLDSEVNYAPLTALANNIPAMQPIVASYVLQNGGAGTVEMVLSYILADDARSYPGRVG